MSQNFGEFNPALTKAVKRIATGPSEYVYFSPHAWGREIDREIDHADVWTCLKKGKVHGPEIIDGALRANVVHMGLHVRVAIGGLDAAEGDWSKLTSIVVCTVIGI